MTNQTHPRPENQYVISYLNLRKAVGILGIALPIVLIVGFLLFDQGCKLPPSISHYYYTGFGTFFTGTLCAVALFLFSYKGPESKDERASMLAAFCALGVAFLPTNPDSDSCVGSIRVILCANDIRNAFHYGFAALLFLTFAYFCLVLFVKTSEKGPTKKKQMRNVIYRVCGWVILISITSILLLTILNKAEMIKTKTTDISTFIFETIALFAFGISWLTKGETFFKDN